MLMSFVLGMPGVKSWNGKWTGAGKKYVIVKNIPKRKAVEIKEHHGYDFGDGWRASVTVTPVDAKVARQLRKESDGFLGYNWMVNEIIMHGRILTDEERNPKE